MNSDIYTKVTDSIVSAIEQGKPPWRREGDMMDNAATIAMERERQAIAAAASEITSLWWANPDVGALLKFKVVESIIQKHFWGFTDDELFQGRRA